MKRRCDRPVACQVLVGPAHPFCLLAFTQSGKRLSDWRNFVLQKFLVPLDGSELAEEALPYAKEMAEKFAGELILAKVIQPIPVAAMASHYGEPLLIDPPATDEMRRAARTYLEKRQQELVDEGIQTRIAVLENADIANAIIEYANREKVDAIIKTTHGRSGLSRWLFGNVATKVLQGADCPIFLVRVSGR